MKMGHTFIVLTICLLMLGALACGEGRECATVREAGLEDWSDQFEAMCNMDMQDLRLWVNRMTGDQSYPRVVLRDAICLSSELGLDIFDGVTVPPEYRCPITNQAYCLTTGSRNGNFTLIMICPQHGQSEVVVRLDG